MNELMRRQWHLNEIDNHFSQVCMEKMSLLVNVGVVTSSHVINTVGNSWISVC